nr:MAG TPA: phosphoribosylformylglycinamidine synthase II [Caudoviricetes sp.]
MSIKENSILKPLNILVGWKDFSYAKSMMR